MMPIAAPTASALPITHQLTMPWASVATTAISMPTALIRFPSRAVFGELRYRRPKMKQIAVMRYAMSTRLAGVVSAAGIRADPPAVSELERAAGTSAACVR